MNQAEMITLFAGGAGLLGFFVGWRLMPRVRTGNESPTLPERHDSDHESTRQDSRSEPPTFERGATEVQFDEFMLAVVDTIDEIELIKADATSETARCLALLQARLQDTITLANGELIRETRWQPTLQRAVKMEPAEAGQTDVRVLRTRATGLKHGTRMLRKQEVVISQL